LFPTFGAENRGNIVNIIIPFLGKGRKTGQVSEDARPLGIKSLILDSQKRTKTTMLRLFFKGRA